MPTTTRSTLPLRTLGFLATLFFINCKSVFGRLGQDFRKSPLTIPSLAEMNPDRGSNKRHNVASHLIQVKQEKRFSELEDEAKRVSEKLQDV